MIATSRAHAGAGCLALFFVSLAGFVLPGVASPAENKALGLQILKPASGDTYFFGSTYVISWTSPGVSYVDIQLFQQYATWSATLDLALNFPDTTGSFPWRVPADNPALVPGWYTIRVRASQNGWMSDSSKYFQILQPSITALPVPAVAVRSTVFPVTWTSAGDFPTVTATLQREQGSTWVDDRVVQAAIPNSNFFSWLVPADLPADRQYRLKLAASSNGAASSLTSAFTAAAGQVQASISGAGYGGGPLLPSQTYDCVWTSRGSVEAVQILLTIGSKPPIVIASGGPSGTSSFTVPADASGEATVAVCSPDCSTRAGGRQEATAAGAISVVAPASLEILPAVILIESPAAWATLRPRDTVQVRWTSTAVVGSVDIGLLVEGAGPTQPFSRTLASGLAASQTAGSFAWAVGDDAVSEAPYRLTVRASAAPLVVGSVPVSIRPAASGVDVAAIAGGVGGAAGGAALLAALVYTAFAIRRRLQGRSEAGKRVAPPAAQLKGARPSDSSEKYSAVGVRKASEAVAAAGPYHVSAPTLGQFAMPADAFREAPAGPVTRDKGRTRAFLPASFSAGGGLLADAPVAGAPAAGRRGTPEMRQRNASMKARGPAGAGDAVTEIVQSPA